MFTTITVGEVVDTNDPQQMGRLKIACPAWGDPSNPTPDQIELLPWVQYGSPMAGASAVLNRGVDTTTTDGLVAYGMWSLPKRGAQALVTLIDNDPMYRVFIAFLHRPHTPHTLPHGRFIDEDGPLSTNEQAVNPTKDALDKAFGSDSSAYERKTRATDFQATAVDRQLINDQNQYTPSNKPDDKDVDITETDGNTYTKRQGYAEDRFNQTDELIHRTTGGAAFDSTVHSWTTPGFHAMSMDDRPENCRVKFRTAGGHQIILDDTNERIYVNVAGGEAWFEMDSNGNIDLFSNNNISMHAVKDFNISSDASVRINGSTGVHINSGSEMRLTSTAGLFINSSNVLDLKSSTNIVMQSSSDVSIKAGEVLTLESSTSMTATSPIITLNSSTSTTISGGSTFSATADTINLVGGTGVVINGGTVSVASGLTDGVVTGTMAFAVSSQISAHSTTTTTASVSHGVSNSPYPGDFELTLPTPPSAPSIVISPSVALDAEGLQSFAPSRLPNHEPWARVMNDLAADQDVGNIMLPEYSYDDPSVGKIDRGIVYVRNQLWHR